MGILTQSQIIFIFKSNFAKLLKSTRVDSSWKNYFFKEPNYTYFHHLIPAEKNLDDLFTENLDLSLFLPSEVQFLTFFFETPQIKKG